MKNRLKYFLFLIICLGLACLSFSCVAPGTGNSGQSDEGGGTQSEQSHVHDFAIKKSDAYYHWQECECGEKSSMGAHAGGEATCVERAICTVCLSPYGSFGEHSLSGKSDNEFHWQECVCGETTTKTAHYGGSATCTELAVCAGCGTAYGETLRLNHTELKFDGEGHWYECSCGDKGEKTAHGGGEATCTELAKCSICGTAYGETLSHNHTELKFDSEEHWYECACGDIINKEKHYGGAPTYTDKPICEGCGTAYGERLVTNLEKDQAKVKEFNLVLAENACENIAEVKKLLVTNGFDASEFVPLDSSNEFYWVAEINRIIIASGENNAIYPEGLIALAEQSKDGWYSLSGRDKNGTVSMITSAINSGEKLEGTINLMGASINLKPTADIVIGGADGDPATIQNLVSDEGTKANANANNEYADNIYYTSLVSTVPAGKTVIVENLVIDGAVVGDTFANISETARNGIIAGQVAGTLIIRNVTIKNSIVFGGYRIGGLVGAVTANATVIIENIALDNVTVKGQTNVALLIGDVKASSHISITNVTHVNCNAVAVDLVGAESPIIENEIITYTKNKGEYKISCAHVTTKYFWVNHGVQYHNADHVPGGEGADLSKYGWTSNDVAMSESWNYHEHSYTKLRTDSNYHWYACSCGAYRTKTAHSGGNATCTSFAKCSTCGVEYGSLKAHEYKLLKNDSQKHWYECECGERNRETVHGGGNATCTSLAKCSTCGEEYGSLKAHEYKILKHDSQKHWYECECGARAGESAHGGGTATCTSLANCATCGTKYGNVKTHSYLILKSDSASHWYECECGAKASETSHSGGTATCTTFALCSTCGTAYGELKSHVYAELNSDSQKHWYECECGAKDGESAHGGGVATCTARAKCSTCGEEYGSIKDHSYTIICYDEEKHWYSCVCGEISGEQAHFGDESACGVCGQAYIGPVTRLRLDKQTVDQMNTALDAEASVNENMTIFDVFDVLAETEMGEKDYKALSKDSYFFYDTEINRVLMVQNGSVIYPEKYVGRNADGNWISLTQTIAKETVTVTDGAITVSTAGQFIGALEKVDDKAASNVKLGGKEVDMMGAALTVKDLTSGETITIENGTISNATAIEAKKIYNGNHAGIDGVYNMAMVTEVKKGATLHLKDLTIKNMNLRDTNAGNCGFLVGTLSGKLILENVTIRNSSIVGYTSVGALVGYMTSSASIEIRGTITIENVTVQAVGGRIGKLIGYMDASMDKITAATGAKIVVKNVTNTIYNCDQNTGDCVVEGCTHGALGFDSTNNQIHSWQVEGNGEVGCEKKANRVFNANSLIGYASARAGENYNTAFEDRVSIEKSGPHTHIYNILKSNSSYHWYECSCGDCLSKTAHSGGTASCYSRARCSVCSQYYGDYAHDYANLRFDSESHWYECSCGDTSGVETHYGGVATETEQAICEGCGEHYGELVLTAEERLALDKQTVENINVVLSDNDCENLYEVNMLLAKNGFCIDNYRPLTKDTYFFWVSSNNIVIHVDDSDKVIYPTSLVEVEKEGWFSLSGDVVKSDDWKDNVNGTTTTVSNGAEFVDLIEKVNTGHNDANGINTIKLSGPVDMRGAVVELGALKNTNVTLEGTGTDTVIKGVRAETEAFMGAHNGMAKAYGGGIFGSVQAGTTVTIKNITVEGVTVGDSEGGTVSHVGILIGNVYAGGKVVIENVKVTNSTVFGYDKVGTLIGSIQGGEVSISDVTVQNVTVRGVYYAASLIGCVSQSVKLTIDAVTVDNVKVELNTAHPEGQAEAATVITDTDGSIYLDQAYGTTFDYWAAATQAHYWLPGADGRVTKDGKVYSNKPGSGSYIGVRFVA